MINLLPPSEKEKIILENKKQLLLVVAMSFFIPGLCFILFLLSINFYILGDINSEKFLLQQAEQKYQTPEFLLYKDIIQNNNKILATLTSFYQKETSSAVILKTLSNVPRPQKLYFNDLSIHLQDNKKASVSLSGFSDSREDLLLFQKSLEDVKEIKNLRFSPESWVNPKQATFHLTFEI